MSKKEEKARQYSNKKVEEKDLYPFYSANTKRRLSTFDAYELEDAFEAGWDAGKQENEHLVWQISEANYEKGKEIGKKEIINKACEWLIEHKEAIETEDNGIMGWIPDYFIEDFRKAMEE